MELELVKKLREAAEKFIHGSVSLQVRESNLIESITDLEKKEADGKNKLSALEQAVSEADGRREKIDKRIFEETKSKREAVENDRKEAARLIEELKEKQNAADDKKKEFESARVQMEKAKADYEAKTEKYEKLMTELNEKKAKFDALFNHA